MRVYSYSKARQQLAELLNRARREGQVEIRRRDGQSFVVRPTKGAGSPLDMPGVDTGLSRRGCRGSGARKPSVNRAAPKKREESA